MQNVIWIPENKITTFIRAVNELILRSKVTGRFPPSIDVTKEIKTTTLKSNQSKGLLKYTFSQVRLVKVILTGQTPVIGEWMPVAKITHKKTAGGYKNETIHITSDLNNCEYITADTKTYAPNCEHCNSKRCKTTFLLKNVYTYELRQIKTTCFNQFTGTCALQGLLSYFTLIEHIMSNDESNHNFNSCTLITTQVALEPMVRTVMAVLDISPYSNKLDADARGCEPTADIISRLFSPNGPESKTIAPHVLESIENKTHDISAVMHYLNHTIANERKTVFSKKVLSVIARGSIDINSKSQIAIFAGAIYGFYKHKSLIDERARERAIRDENKVDEFVGLIGCRVVLELTYKDSNPFSSMKGSTEISANILSFTDNKGRALKALSKANFTRNLIVNNTYKIRAYIQQHRINDGLYETLVSHIKLVK